MAQFADNAPLAGPVPIRALTGGGRTNKTPTAETLLEEDDPTPQGDPVSQGVPLTATDIFSLIVNKMIGTGIYNNPSSVLILTGSKRLAMALWVLGLLYTVFR
jgi:hypothetical protein